MRQYFVGADSLFVQPLKKDFIPALQGDKGVPKDYFFPKKFFEKKT